MDLLALFRPREVLNPDYQFSQARKRSGGFRLGICQKTFRIISVSIYLLGTPEPDVDWYKDNRVIREGGRIKFKFEDDGLCSLLIREAEASDRGRYKCVASNPAGKAQCSAELFIECKSKN